MPTLFKRSNGIYYAVLADERGRRLWVSTREQKKGLALKKLPTLLAAPRPAEKLDPKDDLNLEEFRDEFCSYSERVHARGNTAIYRRAFVSLIRHIGNTPLKSITVRQMDLFKTRRLAEGIARTTVNIELRALKAAFYTAMRWDIIEKNPCKGVRLLELDEEIPAYFRPDDFSRFVKSLNEGWFKHTVLMAAMTGMRRGEILSLTWRCVDLERRMITIESHGEFRTKRGRRRVVPMNTIVVEMLERLKRNASDACEYVFHEGGSKISQERLSVRFKRQVRKLKLDGRLHFHSLRHSFASWLVKEGVSIYDVQKLLGHTSIRVTEIYSHLAPEELHRSVERIAFAMD